MKAVPVLLKRVKTTRRKFHERGRDESLDGKLEKLRRVLNKIDDLFMKVKKNQDELLDTLTEVDGHLRKLDRKRLDQDMDDICKRITDCAHKLLPMDAFNDDSSDDPSSTKQYNNQLLLPQPQHVNVTPDMLQRLENGPRRCLLSLSILPDHAVIKKNQAIYWWIGLALIFDTEWTTAEAVGEDVIDQLLELNLIVPYGNGKCPLVNKFQINSHICSFLKSSLGKENAENLGFYCTPFEQIWLVLEQQNVTLGVTHLLKNTVFNVGASYLNFDFASQRLSEISYLRVLQLGRWKDSPSHHIEVGSQEFLNDLRNLISLRYLSLRGISRIFALPPSIAELKSLKILDLKACHNLETLPDDISSMTWLTHLILSECYLLDGMPKGIDKLTGLQVLKGFVLGSPGVSDLANLNQLRRLSIHIGAEAVIKDGDFESLGKLSALEHLKISWGVSDISFSDIKINLPSSLKKLHLQGFRGQRIPEWLKPSKLPKGLKLKELNITGGKLESMNHDEDRNQWHMEIVRLKYLTQLEIDLTNLQKLFPRLWYALIKPKPKPNHEYIEWIND